VEAWRRRLVIIPYRKPKPQKVIADLDQRILESEASGILNWMLDGLRKLRAEDWQLHMTATQREAVDNLLLESDSHSLFIKEEVTKVDDGQITLNEMYAAYAEYCNERGWAAIGRNKFGSLIPDIVTRQFGKTPRHDVPDSVTGKATRGWGGIGLRTTATAERTLTFGDSERQREWDSWRSPIQ
jgi:putative DNA primase/helicase